VFLIGIGGFGLAALLIELLLRPDPLKIAHHFQTGEPAVTRGGRHGSWEASCALLAFASPSAH
jgi:hypothetical protein